MREEYAQQRPHTVDIERNVYAEDAKRIRTLLQVLQDRAKGEEIIASILRKRLDELGEAKWLAWCAEEFEWKRSAAYRHLNPALMETHNATSHSLRGNVEPRPQDVAFDALRNFEEGPVAWLNRADHRQHKHRFGGKHFRCDRRHARDRVP